MRTSLLLFCQAKAYLVLARTTGLWHYLKAAKECAELSRVYLEQEQFAEFIKQKEYEELGETEIINVKDVA